MILMGFNPDQEEEEDPTLPQTLNRDRIHSNDVQEEN